MNRTNPQPAPTTQKKWASCILLVFSVGCLFFILALGAYFYYMSTRPPIIPVIINITSPESGSVIKTGSLINVSAQAEHRDGITRLEIYDNGRLAYVQEPGLSADGSGLSAAYTWAANPAGRHILMARAYTAKGASAFSAAVWIDVEPGPGVDVNVDKLPRANSGANPSINNLAGASGISPGDLIGANPGLAGMAPGDPLPPGTTVHIPDPTPAPGDPGGLAPPPADSGTPGGGPSSPPAPPHGAPSIPTWNMADASHCGTIVLTWNDTPDETGYNLYRLTSGEVTMRLLASLPANATTYTDPISAPGLYVYTIAAVKDGVEALSVVEGATPPASCFPPPAPAAPNLSLSVVALTANEHYDGLYCYYSVDGSLVERLPAREPGSLIPGPDGLSYSVTSGLPHHGVFNLAGHPSSLPVTLMLKCRGYRGALSLDLGRLQISRPPADWDGSLRTDATTGFSLRYCITTGAMPCSASGTPSVSGLLLPPIEILTYLPAPTNLTMRNTLDACDEYAGGDPARQIGCYLQGLLGVGQNTLYWNWNGGASLWNESNLTGYRVHAFVTDLHGIHASDYFTHDIRPGRRKFALAWLPGECGKRVVYTVQAVAGSQVSVPSDPLSYDTPACLSAVNVHVVFEGFSFGIVNVVSYDGFAAGINQMQFTGILSALDRRGVPMQKITYPQDQSIGEGDYNLANFNLRAMPPMPASVARNFNYLDIPVTDEHQSIPFWFSVIYRNWASHYEEVCLLRQVLPPQRLSEWMLYNHTFHLEGADLGAPTRCFVTIHVTVERLH